MKVMIVGVGKLGNKLAKSLIHHKFDVTVVDSDTKVIERINDHLDVLSVNANGLDIATLKELNISSYTLLVASTGSDETNTIICSLAKKLGCRNTVARIRNPEYSEQLDFIKAEMGIDHVVSSDLKTAEKIHQFITSNDSTHSGYFASGKILVINYNVELTKNIIGKKIIELDHLYGILIVAILRDDELIIPNGSTKILSDDIIYIIGTSETIEAFKTKLKLTKEKKIIRRVMIIGGGNLGYFLAKQLLAQHIKVVIVEQDRLRCKYLTTVLPDALIVHGDATDVDLLAEESLSQMDAFVGVTGYDEQNVLMALIAKHEGVKKVIAKLSRQSYTSLIDRLEIDLAINPINITIGEILKYIRGSMVESVSLILSDRAELTEVVLKKGLSVIGKKVQELGLPKGIIIGAIVNEKNAFIPNGKTILSENDRLIIFSLVSETAALGMFFNEIDGGKKSELWHSYKDPW